MSSDVFRALVSDDENDQSSTDDAFAALHFVAARRLARGKLTVVDATNVQPEARKPLVALAREYHVLPVAIVLDLPERVCHERNRARPDRDFGPHVIRNQRSQLHRSLRGPRARRLPARTRPHVPGGGRCGRHRAAATLEQPETGDRAVRHHRRRPRLLRRARTSAAASSGTTRDASEGRGVTPGRPQGDLRRRSRRPRSAHRGHAEDGDGDVAGRHGAQRSREPRHQVEAEARGPRRHRLARARSHAGGARTARPPEFRADVQKFLEVSSATTSSTTAGSWWRTPA